MRNLPKDTAVRFSLERDAVDSVRGLEQGIDYNMAAP
jgi:hypothetical protein